MEVTAMQTTVQGKQISVGDALRTYVTEKLEEMSSKYFNQDADATVTFSKIGHGHGLIRAQISVRIGSQIMVVADAEEADAYLSFDTAAGKAAKQLRRYKRRLRDHQDRLYRAPEKAIWAARDYTLSNDTEDEPAKDESLVIAEMATNIPTLTVSEAVMRLDLAHQNAFLFRSAKHGGLNMVYRRADGNIGWVDPGDVAKVVKTPEKSAKKAVAKKTPGKKTAKKPAAKSNVKKLPVKKKSVVKKSVTKKAVAKKTKRHA